MTALSQDNEVKRLIPSIFQDPLTPWICVWRYLNLAFRWIEVFGGSLVAMSFLSGDSQNQDDHDADDSNEVEQAHQRRNERLFGLYTLDFARLKDRIARLVFQEDDLLRPLWIMTLTTTYIFRILDNKSIVLSEVEDFTTSCPESGRRTQTSALVKLFAAGVTTIGIHGHLGSLSGSGSWRSELFRASEVVLSPLAATFSLGVLIWIEVAAIFSPRRGPWTKPVGLRYRLARMCSVRIEAPSGSTDKVLQHRLAAMNPEHVEMVAKKRDLKWFGRAIFLIILLGQYVQAFVLLARRLLANTAATVDLAMFLWVECGLTALTQSLTISLVNTAWRLSPTTSPCIARACQRAECIALKQERQIPTKKLHTILFGYNITGIPRIILFEVVAGYVHLNMLLGSQAKVWALATAVVGLYAFWHFSIRIFVCIELVQKLLFGDPPSDETGNEPLSPAATAVAAAADSESPIVEGLPLTRSKSVMSTPSDSTTTHGRELPSAPKDRTVMQMVVQTASQTAFHSAAFALGCVAIVVCLFAVFYILFYVVNPAVYMYYKIFSETSSWKAWDNSTSCPQMWKDGLEDEVWWF